ncbi:phosphonate ABC transporter, permease protein PhnE [Amycolatopsis keratiniphila]|uniref:phosphonate ABC transporter, permease protein PhnE n=1 Tax=Amycolatopsis keratiniphila TaxID=129921 RepID=UPI00087A83BD|nr:phosphonate ABC transporter, permease protein PhnE [Amycolatopsis keratiniphila]SDU66574.1 phosphonate transport system permease protein [Amycolatopsis keratiniphila]
MSVEPGSRPTDTNHHTDQPTPTPAPGAGRTSLDHDFASAVRYKRSKTSWLLLVVAIAAVAWSLQGTGVSVGSLVAGWDGAQEILAGLFPPQIDQELLQSVGTAVLETLQISIAALFFGTVVGIVLAVLMAGNIGAPRWLAIPARWVATLFRAVPELLWALVFVAAVGLGPAAGVYAISLHAAGMLAKLVSEQIEAVDIAPVEAMRLTGASKLATAVLAIIPQARNNIASLILYQWECNIRSSAIIGFVGAGGLGQALGISMRLFRYQELATLLIALLFLVLLVDQISRFLRQRMGAQTR